MEHTFSELEKIGLDNQWQEQIEETLLNDRQLARVIAVNKNSYIIHNGSREIFAEVTGKFLFQADSSLDYPTVGDWVYTQIFDNDSFAVIHDLAPRRSLLKRKTAGKQVDFQLIAANIDFAFIIQSLDLNYNLRRLERYLVMVNEAHICPVVLLSKSDLVSSEEVAEKTAEILKIQPGIEVLAFSNNSADGPERVKQLLQPAKTYCLLGSSGVGKTTLLNNFLNEEKFATNTVRDKDSRGRHTTVSRQLIILENGAMIIDTPGMRELGMMDVEAGLDDTFFEITALTSQCRFNDCTHTIEAGCAVLAAVKEGTIDVDRYQNYLKMQKEAAYNEMTYLQKRQKDKQFGKMVKSILKNKVKK
ncbi:MAG TPA: ribosome small subunit-dependent GTPase A [bacterium]|nr:ribosome small subunit-dependent GTPase A [bacterium]HPN45909.1 ribosome small subunit-dependent GTPase A [bacterium]